VELRYAIYDIVKDFDLKCEIKGRSPAGALEERNAVTPCLPFKNLAMSCSVLAQEIRAHQVSLPAGERFATLCIDGYDMTLSYAPCRSTELRSVRLVKDARITRDGGTATGLMSLLHRPFIRSYLAGVQDVQIFVHIDQHPGYPLPDAHTYEDRVRRVREAYESFKSQVCESYPTWVEGRVVRLMEFSYEPWKRITPDTGSQRNEQDGKKGNG
jgi:hypothetical protein